MPWNTPQSWSVGEVVTAAKMTMNVKENMEFIKTFIDMIHSASRTNMAGSLNLPGGGPPADAPDGGPEVTVTIGDSGLAIVGHGADHMGVSGNLGRGSITYRTYGATVSAQNVYRTDVAPTYSTLPYTLRHIQLETGLTPGATSFRQQYGCSTVGRAIFFNRYLFVIPL